MSETIGLNDIIIKNSSEVQWYLILHLGHIWNKCILREYDGWASLVAQW